MTQRFTRWTGWLVAGLACSAWSTQAATVQVDVVDDAGRPVAGAVVFLESPAARALVKPLPQAEGSRPQPTSSPGQPSGRQGPIRPIQAPLALWITENMLKPFSDQAPVTAAIVRQAWARG